MLDKSVPYAGLFMRREAGEGKPSYELPEGFQFAFFSDGSEADWARIEASVLEFDGEFAALMFFKRTFIPHIDELYRRCVFVETSDGVKVATTTAWWSDSYEVRKPWIMWVAVDPKYQGLGLGRAIIARATVLMIELEGDLPIYLRTQTWSHKAIGIYQTYGYFPTAEKSLYSDSSDNYRKAMRILKRLNR